MLTSKVNDITIPIYIHTCMKKYMYVELPKGVCCNIVTANKHIGISILRAKYYVPRPSTERLKLN